VLADAMVTDVDGIELPDTLAQGCADNRHTPECREKRLEKA
jgi:hypothetical protein